jgi:hypothetical protein
MLLESPNLNQAIEVERVTVWTLPYLVPLRSNKVRKNSGSCRSVKNEVQNHIVSLFPQIEDLPQQVQPVRLEDHEIVHKWVLLHNFRVRFARNNVQPDPGIQPLQRSQDWSRNDHVSDAIVPENQNPIYTTKIDRSV